MHRIACAVHFGASCVDSDFMETMNVQCFSCENACAVLFVSTEAVEYAAVVGPRTWYVQGYRSGLGDAD